MKNLFFLVKFHWPALIISAIACAVVITPGIVGRLAAGAEYQNVYHSNNGDWLYYAARVRDVSEGHGGGNQYLSEHAEDADVNIPGAEATLGFIVRTFHIDTIRLLKALNAITPIIITLIFYALLFQLSRSRWISASLPLFLAITNLWNLNKTIHPQINLPLTLLFLLVWFILLERLERSKNVCIKEKFKHLWPKIGLCGILLGLLYFIYLYDWSFLWVTLMGTTILGLIKRKFDIIILNGLIIAMSVPFFIRYLFLLHAVFTSPFYEELTLRNGAYHTHLPESLPRFFVAVIALSLITLFVRYANIQRQRVTIAMIGLVAANLIYPNHHIITGTVYQMAAHWAFMPILIFSMAVAFILPRVQLNAQRSRRAMLAAALFTALFFATTARLSAYMSPPITRDYIDTFIDVQRYGRVINFLNTSTSADSVVLTDDRLSYFIPAYTHNAVYYLHYIFCLPATNREIAERYLLANLLDPAFLEDENLGIGPDNDIFWEGPYRIEETPQYRLLYGEPQNTIYDIEQERAFVRNVMNDLKTAGSLSFDGMQKYKLDYIVWDKLRFPNWIIPEEKVTRVFEADNLIVFSVNN